MFQPLCKRFEAQSIARHNARIYSTPSVDGYLRHNDWVRAMIPKAQLLEYEPSQGWAPLCEFLGVPIPEGMEFPHVNESKTLRRYFTHAAKIGCISWALLGLICGGIWYSARAFDWPIRLPDLGL